MYNWYNDYHKKKKNIERSMIKKAVFNHTSNNHCVWNIILQKLIFSELINSRRSYTQHSSSSSFSEELHFLLVYFIFRIRNLM